MYYRLSDDVALRSWKLVEHACYRKGRTAPIGLRADEYELLSLCDGLHDLDPSRLLEQLSHDGFCQPCSPNTPLDVWQKPRRFENRLMPFINWSITGRCNYNCRHCYMAKDNAPIFDEFTLDECRGLMDQMVDCGVQTLDLTGGEPFLHPHFYEILEEAALRKLWLRAIFTNASRFSRESLQRIKDIGYTPELWISFDGLSYHDWMRATPGAESRTLDGIALAAQMGFLVEVQICLFRDNVAALKPTVKLLSDLGVKRFRIIRTSESPRWNENAADQMLGVAEYYDIALDFLKYYLENGFTQNLEIWQLIKVHPETREYSCDTVRAFPCKPGNVLCRGIRGRMSISADGRAAPCSQLSGIMAMRGDDWGSVKREGLKQLLTDSAYLDHIMATVGDLSAHDKKCADCPYFKFCQGGCRCLAYGIAGDYMGHDPLKCVFYEEGYWQKIDAVFARYGEDFRAAVHSDRLNDPQ